MSQYKGIEFFWENIKRDKGKNFKKVNLEELKMLRDNKIIELDKDRWLTYKDDLLHFLNIEHNTLLSPSYFDLNAYDIMFSKLIGNENAYELLKTKIFDICPQQIHDKNKRGILDDIVDQLKEGVYGKVEETNFSFIEIYPYIVSNTFFLRDMTALKLAKNNPI